VVGRPTVPPDIRKLIHEMSIANPLWGAPRIHGELLKLGIEIGQTSERRARLVNAIARGRRWLDEIVSGSAIDMEQIATRQKCSVRQVNMTISLAFLAPEPRQSRGRRSFASRHWCHHLVERTPGL